MSPMDSRRPIAITITPGTIVATVLILAGFYAAYYLRELLLVVITAVVLASAIEPATLWLMKKGLPRVLSVVLIYLTTFVVLALGINLFANPLVNETKGLVQDLPTYLEELNIAPEDVMQATDSATVSDQLLRFQSVLGSSGNSVLSAASSVFGGLMSFVLIVVLSFYFAVQERGLDDFLRMITPVRKQDYILDLWKRAQHKMGRWLQGQLLLSLLVGVAVWIGLVLLGVPYALLLGIAAAVLELIPVFGSILAAIPAVIVAFLDGGTSSAVFVIILYIVVNQLQGNIVYPLVVQKVLGISPLVVILAIIVGYQIAGFLGVLIAVPIAAAVQEYVNDVQRGRQKLAYPDDDGTVT